MNNAIARFMVTTLLVFAVAKIVGDTDGLFLHVGRRDTINLIDKLFLFQRIALLVASACRSGA